MKLLGNALLALIAVASLFIGGPARAEYPDRPITMIVPYPPGELPTSRCGACAR